mmetsp:Transcript_9226/g.15313  ORF Transcript_9226/g.15313 Transcript_9226/m.15313 type:complete len:208 (-) Transcript_9226:292-915(-)
MEAINRMQWGRSNIGFVDVVLIHGSIAVQLFVGHIAPVSPQVRRRINTLCATSPATIWGELEMANWVGTVKVNVLGSARLDALGNIRDEPRLLPVAQPAPEKTVAAGPTSPASLHLVHGQSIAYLYSSLIETVDIRKASSGNRRKFVVGIIHHARVFVIIGENVGVVGMRVRVTMIVTSLVVTNVLGIENMLNRPELSGVALTPYLD